jgi:putative Mg2+ transporter-C (MgtC) family protein
MRVPVGIDPRWPNPLFVGGPLTTISQGEVLLRLAIAVLLCGAIGLERQARDQVAGLRTHIIVGLGAALFTLVSAYAFTGSGTSHVDPTRIAAQVVSGIGFLGAGVILRHGATVRGVTTAAALWISAAIGMASAAGYYFGAAATTAVALAALAGLRKVRPVLQRLGTETLSLDLRLSSGGSVHGVLGEFRRLGLQLEGLETQHLEDGSERVLVDVRAARRLDVEGILSELSRSPDVRRIDLAVLHSLDLNGAEESGGIRQARVRVPRREPSRPGIQRAGERL